MDTPTITMPKAEARRHLKSYRAALHKKADAEYEAIATAYQTLAQGKAVLNLADAFGQAPVDDKGRPRLCIARADQRQARIYASGWPEANGIVCTTLVGWRRGRAPNMAQISIAVPGLRRFPEGYALVPIVPPAVKKHYALRTTAVLWEVEQWADRAIGAQPDRDPMLLRHLGGDLWAVLGAWDLTDVERAVMRGRAL